MKKLILVILFSLALAHSAIAASTGTFPIAVNIPPADSVNFIVNKVTGPSNAPTFVTNPDGKNLNFGVTFNGQNSIYLANESFAIDLAPNGIANYSSVGFSYSSETNPTGQAANTGLSTHGTITPVKVVGNQETQLAGFGVRLGGTLPSITNSQVAGGFLRVYVGLATGELVGGAGTAAKIPGSVPFSGADRSGDYKGTLTITATLV